MDKDAEGDRCDLDLDGDLVPQAGPEGTAFDNCPFDPNGDQLDDDRNGKGNSCDQPRTAVAPASEADLSRAEPLAQEKKDESVAAKTRAFQVAAGFGVCALLLAAVLVFVRLRKPRDPL